MANSDNGTTPEGDDTAQALAIFSLLLFALTVLPPIIVGLWKGKLDADLVKFIENIASVEIGPIGVVFGFYFSRHISK